MRRIRAPGRRGLRERSAHSPKRSPMLASYGIRNNPPSSVFILTCASRRATLQELPTESGFALPGLFNMVGLCAFLILIGQGREHHRSRYLTCPSIARRYFCTCRGTRSLRHHTPKHTPTTSKTRQQPCAHTRSGLERTLVRGVSTRAPAPALSPTTRTSLFPRRRACRLPDLSHVFDLFLSGA